ETDTTLIDFVSDMRAPTPTAAAELAVPVRLDLLAWVDQQGARLSRALSTGVTQRQQRVRDLGRALPKVETLVEGPRQRLDYLGERLPGALNAAAAKKRVALSNAGGALRPATLARGIAAERRRLDDLGGRLTPALQRKLNDKAQSFGQVARGLQPRLVQGDVTRKGEQLTNLIGRLSDRASRQQSERQARLDALDRLRETLGYKETLKRGYAVVRGDGQVVTDTKAAKAARDLEVEFADGRVTLNSNPQGSLF
ncbi:MAG: exodeoxyribonuclease VII large subunit, partial [Yoonia sp.]